jgi:hypothetical protein
LCERESVNPKDRPSFEKELVRQFRRTYHQYSVHVPDDSNILEWLSLMQHHGAPTRLLDFTYSLYVALYFALENCVAAKCVVWAIDGKWAMDESIRLMASAGKENPSFLKKRYEESDMGAIAPFFFEYPYVRCACPQNPFRLNERLAIQKGVFLIQGSIATPFLKNLRAMTDHSKPKNVRKLEIPKASRRDFLQRLFDMNITRTSLFPGLDGYAQSLGVYHPAFHWIHMTEKHQ